MSPDNAFCSTPADAILNQKIAALIAARKVSDRKPTKKTEAEARIEQLREELLEQTTKESLQWRRKIEQPTSKSDLKKWLAEHDGFDVSTKDGLQSWLQKLLHDPRVCDVNTPQGNTGTKASGQLNLKKEKLAALKEYERGITQTHLEKDIDVGSKSMILET